MSIEIVDIVNVLFEKQLLRLYYTFLLRKRTCERNPITR